MSNAWLEFVVFIRTRTWKQWVAAGALLPLWLVMGIDEYFTHGPLLAALLLNTYLMLFVGAAWLGYLEDRPRSRR